MFERSERMRLRILYLNLQLLQDRGQPECDDDIILTASTSMVINVRDGPDRAPVFPTAVYPASLKEGNYSVSTLTYV